MLGTRDCFKSYKIGFQLYLFHPKADLILILVAIQKGVTMQLGPYMTFNRLMARWFCVCVCVCVSQTQILTVPAEKIKKLCMPLTVEAKKCKSEKVLDSGGYQDSCTFIRFTMFHF